MGGTLYEIQPETPYPTNYNAVVEQAKKEIRAGYLPALKNKITDFEAYDTVFVGTPNWWSTVAPPIATFLTENNTAGKTVVPFCTHGGGGLAEIVKNITKLCPDSTVLSGFAAYGGGAGTQAEIESWLHKIGM